MLSKLEGLKGPSLSEAQAKLGFSVVGRKVEEIQAWGPAHVSNELAIGDEIIKVDGVAVESDDIAEHIRGTDEPESIVRLTVSRADGSGVEIVDLPRYFSPVFGVSEILHQTLTELGEDMIQAHEALLDETRGSGARREQQALDKGLSRLEMVVDLGEEE